jgi:PAS domain S-box-containing protein
MSSLRAFSPAAGDLRSLAFEHGAAASAVVRLEDGRARVVLANARLAALAGECDGRWLDEIVAGAVGHAELEAAAMTGHAIAGSVGDRAVEMGATALPGAEGFILTLHDVTERANEVRALSEAVGRLEDIMDNSAALIYVKDTHGRYTLVNQYFERRFGLRREDVIGHTDREVFPLHAARVYEAHDRQVMRTGRALEVEEPATGVEDGSWLSVKFTLLDPEGRPYALGGISTDITDRKRAEAAARDARDEAQRANEAKSEFLSRMSHELRTPLNAILGFGQLLALEQLEDAAQARVERILRAGHHLLELINEVLDITRIEAGGQALSLEPVHCCDPLVDALELVRPLAVERGIELVSDMHGGLHRYVLADSQRLKQVALNLLSNAIKYNRAGGIVRTYFNERVPGRLRLLVVDTGPGLDREQAARVFLPFERLAADSTDIEGTGLGLALSRSLAQAMGGWVDIEHSAPGEGSAFFVELPLVDRPAVTAAESARLVSQPYTWDLGAARILYVEDNLSNLELVESILARSPGVELIPAMQGSLALDLAARHDPDLVLLDLDLPDLAGEEVLRLLRADSRTDSIPVIVLSADATPAQLARMQGEGIVAYLTKPLNIGLFLETLRAALAHTGPI